MSEATPRMSQQVAPCSVVCRAVFRLCAFLQHCCRCVCALSHPYQRLCGAGIVAGIHALPDTTVYPGSGVWAVRLVRLDLVLTPFPGGATSSPAPCQHGSEAGVQVLLWSVLPGQFCLFFRVGKSYSGTSCPTCRHGITPCTWNTGTAAGIHALPVWSLSPACLVLYLVCVGSAAAVHALPAIGWYT